MPNTIPSMPVVIETTSGYNYTNVSYLSGIVTFDDGNEYYRQMISEFEQANIVSLLADVEVSYADGHRDVKMLSVDINATESLLEYLSFRFFYSLLV